MRRSTVPRMTGAPPVRAPNRTWPAIPPGYAYRNVGRLDDALRHYEAALRLNPRHRGAHEYIGEAYLMVNDPAKAEEHLAALKEICVVACEEYEDLEKAIAAYQVRHGP
jgi:tetratricopeptide (TPR) repeat protein